MKLMTPNKTDQEDSDYKWTISGMEEGTSPRILLKSGGQ